MNGLIGDTPLLKISYLYLGEKRNVYMKVEWNYFTGSIKDRMTSYVLKKAIKEGIFIPGMPIVEATSGNTGISLSALGAYYGSPVIIYMPDTVSLERKKLMESYGAEVISVSSSEGGFLKCRELARKKALEVNGYYPDQFSNLWNPESYQELASEILDKLSEVGGFVSGIGTGGTFIGLGKLLKEKNPDMILAVLEPDTSPLLSEGILGSHEIEGIGDDFVPDLFDRNLIDQIYLIHDQDAINMSRKFARELGLGVGISSGANFLASVLLEDSLGTPIVSVFPDDQKKYLSTNYSNFECTCSDFLSNQITLLDYEVLK